MMTYNKITIKSASTGIIKVIENPCEVEKI